MMITEANISAHELIGLTALVADSRDPTLRNRRGRIVYETRNLLILSTTDGILKKIPKRVVTLSLTLPDGQTCTVHGSDLVGNPVERIQRLGKKKRSG